MKTSTFFLTQRYIIFSTDGIYVFNWKEYVSLRYNFSEHKILLAYILRVQLCVLFLLLVTVY